MKCLSKEISLETDEKSIKNFNDLTDLNYNCKTFVIQTSLAVEIKDYIRRIQNLNATYELLFDKVQLAVNCNDCPFIEVCIYQEGKVKDCKIKMLNRSTELNVF